MADLHELRKALEAPFPADDIEWRIGSTNKARTSGLALAYLTSRAVMARLDDVLGIDGWHDSYERWGDRGVLCRLSCRLGTEWVTREDGADETDIESTKGGISSALKRAAVKFGIGRYLYDLPQVWVELRERGAIFAGRGKYFDPPPLPSWALPPGAKQATPKPTAPPEEPAKGPDMRRLFAVASEHGLDEEHIRILAHLSYGATSLKELAPQQVSALLAGVEKHGSGARGIAEGHRVRWEEAMMSHGATA